jgi:hypothetical protein
MTRLLTGAGVLVLAVLALARADVPAKKKPAKAPAKPVTVPFELLKSGHMAVQVKVNGKGPYKLIFDTGAPINLIDNKVAKDAKLLKGKAPPPAFPGLGTVAEAKVKTLEVGGLKAANVQAVVMDHPTIKAISDRLGPIHGIIGFPFFARYRMTLDYKAKTLTFAPSSYKPPDVVRGMVRALVGTVLGRGTKVLAPAGQWGIVADKESDDDKPGVEVKEVRPGSPAAKAGLKKGDRLLTVDDRWTDSAADLSSVASLIKPGTEVVLRVQRGKKEVKLKVKPSDGL